ncbi:MAG: aldo/keto reductase [Acutalibacteraceae bacterium]
MEKRKFENIGAESSLLGFGCMRLPQIGDDINEEESLKLIDYAYNHGVKYFDTAYPYINGKSEPFVGKALKKYDRSSFYIATKLPIWLCEKTEDVEKYFNEQLERLQMDYIDFYLIHAVDAERFQKILDLKVLDVLDSLKAKGKIKYLGLSFHDEYEAFEKIINYRKWDFIQLQLNYIDIREQAGMKGYYDTERLGIPVIVMEPVKGGTLAKLPDEVEKVFKDLDPDASTASWAMRWCGTLPNVKVILSGMSTFEQVEDNLKTFTDFKPLSEKEANAVKQVADILNSRMRNQCTDCRYCMPCPKGVNIPGCFDKWNKYAVYGDSENAKKRWADTKDEEKPFNCVGCGICETKCPQKISIREDLKNLQIEMDNIK